MPKLQVYCPLCNRLFNSEQAMLDHYDNEHTSKERSTIEKEQPKTVDKEEPKKTYPKKQPIKEQPIKEPPAVLISDLMSDEEIKRKIAEDISNLKNHEAGSKWMYMGALLSFNSTEQILASGLKAIIDQNKIMIRQNELILRSLNRNDGKKQNSTQSLES